VDMYREEVEDVYRFQEVDTDDEKHGALANLAHSTSPSGRPYNPDELYFNGMDLREWERRNGAIDGLAYDNDYGFPEDEGYYDEAGGVAISQAEYEDIIFHAVLDKIRQARATGDPDVDLTPEEHDIYRSRMLRQNAPAVRPPAAASARPISLPTSGTTNTANVPTPNVTGGSISGSIRSSKSKQRTSIFAPRPKKERPSDRKRAPSNISPIANQPAPQPGPGFVVPGPDGQPIYTPINAYTGRMAQGPAAVRSSGPPSRPGSRAGSMSSRISPRVTPPKDMPGAFPGSPRFQQAAIPPWPTRPTSSSSRQSFALDNPDLPPSPRSYSSPIQQPVRLVPFPVADYQHYAAEPYQYHASGQSTSSQASSPTSPQTPFTRRVSSGPVDGSYIAPSRRVPVQIQRVPVPSTHSYSDPLLGPRSSGLRDEVNVEAAETPPITIDMAPQATAKSPAKSRKRSGHTRRKN
jgi:hypothetical protein